MAFTATTVMDGFIAITLMVASLTLLRYARRRQDILYLAFFLALVSLNFAFTAVARDTNSLVAGQAAIVTLALDPLFLLLFVSTYPYDQRTPAVWWLLGASMATALVGTIWSWVDPEIFVAGLRITAGLSDPGAPGFLLLIVHLAGAYLAAWLLAVRSSLQAPTRGLARRGTWLTAAVGVAVLPRLGLLVGDLGLASELVQADPTPYRLLLTAVIVAGAAVAWLPGALLAWLGPGAHREPARLGVLSAGGLALAVASATVLEDVLPGLREVATDGVVGYSVRWVIFATVLTYAILTYGLVDTRRAHRAILPTSAGLAVGGLGFMVGMLVFQPMGDAVLRALASLGMGTMVGLVASIATRGGLQRAFPGSGGGESLQLELYLAALEAAWATGPPGPRERRRLDRERRRLGIDPAAGAALEHTVSLDRGPRPGGLQAGQEPVPGVVLEQPLGTGSLGRAFLATDHSQGRPVVVKAVDEAELGGTEARRRITTEVRVLAELDHPRILPVLDVEHADGRLLLVRAYGPGQTLEEVLEAGRLAPTEVARLASDLLDALEATHAHGVVHRDLKPSNVLVDGDGRATLFDFDVAHRNRARAPGRVATATSLGSPGTAGTVAYMAPEQARGQATDARTDLFALGLVLAEALTGRPRRRVEGRSLYDALNQAANQPVDLADLPSAWAQALAPAVALAPEDRYTGASEMHAAIRGIAGA